MPEGIAYVGTNVIAGTGLDLNYIGNHCFAYSGNVSLSTSDKTQLDFNTGAGYIKARFIFTGPASLTNPSGERDSMFTVKLNDLIVAFSHRLTGSSLLGTGETTLDLILPPYTHVEVLADSSGSDVDYYTAVAMTGRVIK